MISLPFGSIVLVWLNWTPFLKRTATPLELWLKLEWWTWLIQLFLSLVWWLTFRCVSCRNTMSGSNDLKWQKIFLLLTVFPMPPIFQEMKETEPRALCIVSVMSCYIGFVRISHVIKPLEKMIGSNNTNKQYIHTQKNFWRVEKRLTKDSWYPSLSVISHPPCRLLHHQLSIPANKNTWC